jgi:Flp pilus assembly protein TadG
MTVRDSNRRGGMVLVEMTLVLILFSMFVLGIFEYSRYLYVLHLANNAARDGARYAVVNVDKPASFDTTNYTDSSGRVYPSIQSYTTSVMAGSDKQLTSFQVAVYAVDAAGLAQTPTVIRAKSTSTTVFPDPFNASDPNKVAWNSAAFGDRVAVTVRGTYKPSLPIPLLMPPSITIYATAIMGSEG